MKTEENSKTNGKALYSLAELAQQAGVSVTLLRRLISSGRLSAVRVGRLVRVHLVDWQDYLEAHRVQGRSDATRAEAGVSEGHARAETRPLS